ncbi:MAG: phosphoribosyltransferase family protein [Thermoproteus sp. AZ2]|uniref:Phosphoribosyltransferase family protein n=1 Tax=Thermoproteus sp. AZ2 TaxID=1609232 RepID=A0ACC6V379_9CREN
MSAGLLSIYSFGPPTELGPLVYYGLLAQRNRGEAFEAYVHDGESIRRVEVSQSLSIRGIAAVGCASAEGGCCVEGRGYVLCKSGVEDAAPGHMPDKTSYVALTEGGDLVVYRSSLWHLAIGAYGFDLAIAATETAAIEVLGGEVRRSLRPGEALTINKYGVRSARRDVEGAVCALDVVYTMRPDSYIDGVAVAEVRGAVAGLLRPVEGDVVVGVPESGAVYAALLAAESGKPYLPAFVQTTRGRSALLDDANMRLALIQLKANPVEALLRGRRVFLVDDSLITGMTLKAISHILRQRAGVKEVRAAVVLPPLRDRCPYGAVTPSRGAMAANSLTREQLKLALEVDDLRWPPLEEVERVFKAKGLRPCLKCLLPPGVKAEEK